MSDPIAPHSAPISAYMSVHSATNLAYVRYFSKIDSAISATFKNINAQGFTVAYVLPDGVERETFIMFKTPLTKREDIRPVLEEMAKEAETALGLPSSLAGPPPLKAIAKAFYAQATDMYTPPEPAVPLDTFYSAEVSHQLVIAAGLGALGLLTLASEEYLARQFPPQVLEFRHAIGDRVLHDISKVVLSVHAIEGLLAFGICVRRGWYSPINICKWTLSTTLFGVASMSKLLKHAKKVKAE